jgi:hypothetical protein
MQCNVMNRKCRNWLLLLHQILTVTGAWTGCALVQFDKVPTFLWCDSSSRASHSRVNLCLELPLCDAPGPSWELLITGNYSVFVKPIVGSSKEVSYGHTIIRAQQQTFNVHTGFLSNCHPTTMYDAQFTKNMGAPLPSVLVPHFE